MYLLWVFEFHGMTPTFDDYRIFSVMHKTLAFVTSLKFKPCLPGTWDFLFQAQFILYWDGIMQLHMTVYRGNVPLGKKHWQTVFWAFKKFLVHSDGNRDSI